MYVHVVRNKFVDGPKKRFTEGNTYSSPNKIPFGYTVLELVLKFIHFRRLWYHFVALRKYSSGDAFVGYHADTAASVVLQVTSNIEESEFSDGHSQDKV